MHSQAFYYTTRAWICIPTNYNSKKYARAIEYEYSFLYECMRAFRCDASSVRTQIYSDLIYNLFNCHCINSARY